MGQSRGVMAEDTSCTPLLDLAIASGHPVARGHPVALPHCGRSGAICGVDSGAASNLELQSSNQPHFPARRLQRCADGREQRPVHRPLLATSGLWEKGNFRMKFWPDSHYSVAKVYLMTRVWHPLIDEEGIVSPAHIQLAVAQGRQALSMTQLVLRMMLLFMVDGKEPITGAQNKDAAKMLRTHFTSFQKVALKNCLQYARPVCCPSHELARTIAIQQ